MGFFQKKLDPIGYEMDQNYESVEELDEILRDDFYVYIQTGEVFRCMYKQIRTNGRTARFVQIVTDPFEGTCRNFTVEAFEKRYELLR